MKSATLNKSTAHLHQVDTDLWPSENELCLFDKWPWREFAPSRDCDMTFMTVTHKIDLPPLTTNHRIIEQQAAKYGPNMAHRRGKDFAKKLTWHRNCGIGQKLGWTHSVGDGHLDCLQIEFGAVRPGINNIFSRATVGVRLAQQTDPFHTLK